MLHPILTPGGIDRIMLGTLDARAIDDSTLESEIREAVKGARDKTEARNRINECFFPALTLLWVETAGENFRVVVKPRLGAENLQFDCEP